MWDFITCALPTRESGLKRNQITGMASAGLVAPHEGARVDLSFRAVSNSENKVVAPRAGVIAEIFLAYRQEGGEFVYTEHTPGGG